MNTQTIHQNTSSGLALMGGQPTMTSLEIAELVKSRHDSVKRAIERLAARETIELPPTVGVRNHLGQTVEVYLFSSEEGKRDSFVVVAQLSPEFTGALVDRWQELEANLADQQPIIPKSLPEALRLAADLAEKNEALTYERDEAIRTKALIGSRREATAMATASAAKREAERLKNELGKGVRQATIMAVERAIGEKLGRRAFVPLRRWCKENGVEAALVPDDRYGEVRAWPAEAWVHCYDIDLGELFGEEL